LAEPILFAIDNFEQASVEAQNAFLKRLEEPQKNVSYVLLARKDGGILPTIISRCKTIRVTNRQVISEQSKTQALEFIDSTIPERFAKISKITKREDALKFLEDLVISLHELLPKKPNLAKATKAVDTTLNRIKQNANPTLQLTSLSINI
jgi:hypothetical protein